MIELAFCVLGIYGCFLSWGVLQERVTTTPYYDPTVDTEHQQPVYFKHYVFLNLVQALCACLVAYLYLILFRPSGHRSLLAKSSKHTTEKAKASSTNDPKSSHLHLMWDYAKVALYSTCASPFGYAALKHVDYPTMILAKSCKLVPVMLMSFLLHRRTFRWHKYLSVLLITTGVSLFMLWHEQPGSSGSSSAVKTSSSLLGLTLLAINLAIDGATNSTQDHMFMKHGIDGTQMMFFMNLFSSVLMIIYLTFITPFVNADLSSGMWMALEFCRRYPRCIEDILMFGIFGSIGQVFIFHTLQRFGSLILVTVNVTRKMFSMLLSIFWFQHSLGMGQWGAVATVFFGISLDAYMSSRSAGGKKAPDSKQKKTN